MAKLSTGMKRQRLRDILKKGKPRKMKPKWGNKWKRVAKSGSGRRLR
jgi:hypothetical protein